MLLRQLIAYITIYPAICSTPFIWYLHDLISSKRLIDTIILLSRVSRYAVAYSFSPINMNKLPSLLWKFVHPCSFLRIQNFYCSRRLGSFLLRRHPKPSLIHVQPDITASKIAKGHSYHITMKVMELKAMPPILFYSVKEVDVKHDVNFFLPKPNFPKSEYIHPAIRAEHLPHMLK